MSGKVWTFAHSSFKLKDKKLTAAAADLFGRSVIPDRLSIIGKKITIDFVQLKHDDKDVVYYSPTLQCLSNHPECRGYRVILKK
jgi:hypothetical protein